LWAGESLLLTYVLNISSMIMVTVGTYVAGRFVFRDNFSGSGWSWGKPRYCMAVISFALLLWVAPTLLDLGLGLSTLPVDLPPSQIGCALVLLFVTLVPSFGEKFGWRGYLLPHLARRHTARTAVMLHAVIWWAWHLPVLVAVAAAYGSGPLWSGGLDALVEVTVVLLLAIGFIPTVLHAVIFAYIWSRSESLALATVYDGAYDGLRDSSSTTIGLGPIAGLWSVSLLFIVGLVLLWRSKWTGILGSDHRAIANFAAVGGR
jgi:uncharacterized protein